MFSVAITLFFGISAVREPEAKEFHAVSGKVLPYRIQKPEQLEPGKKYPLVLFLHGAGERGTDNKKQLVWFWDARKPSPMTRPEVIDAKAIVVVPQCPEGKQFVDVPWSKGSYKSPPVSEPMKLTLELVDSLVKDLPVDPDRIYVIGMSMGGYGAFDAIQRRPELFAAAIPICGAGDPSRAKEIAHVAVWAFHGDKDDAVPVSGSRDMIDALKKAGASPRYTEYPGTEHNSWSPAFAEKEFWTWLLPQKRQSTPKK
jgi:predicted peptidase